MIRKIVNNLTFIKRLPKQKALRVINFLIGFDHIFWKLRLKLIILITFKNSKINKILKSLSKNGYAIYDNFYEEKEINEIKKECEKILDILPLDQVSSKTNITNLVLKNGIAVEKLNGSIKIKRLNYVNNYFKKITKKIEMRIIYFIYQMTWHSPLLIYNLVHDGSFEHPAILQKAGEKMIAGQPHIDNALHSLRCALALNQVNTDNGPTVVFEKSMHLKNIKEAHKNLLLNDFDFDTGSNSSHNINQQDLDLLNNQSKSIEVTCKKGDLILVDLKNAHYQKILKQGQRHLLWYYN